MTALASISPVVVLTNHMVIGGAEVWVATVSHWLAERGLQVIVAASPGELVDRLHPNVRYHAIPLTDVRFSLPIAVLRVRRLLREYRPRVIIANSLATTWVARLATLSERVPIVEVAHGWPHPRYRWAAPLARVASLVVPVSADVAGRLREGGVPDRKLRVVQNGVDFRGFVPGPEAQRSTIRTLFQAGSEEIVVSNVGRFSTQKAQHRIIEAAERLASSHPQVRFGIIGYGEREGELRDLVSRRGLGERVTLLLRRPDVPKLLMASDIYLSCSSWEGMPLSTIEAMGAGLPIVMTDVEGARELVTPENGILVPENDVSAMAEAIARLAVDADQRRRMGAASRARAMGGFSLERMCRDLVDVLVEATRSA